MENIIKDIVDKKRTCYFVSPHLDDAAFSAGGLISYLAKRTKVIVVTLFTEAGTKNHSLSAVSYVNQCGYKKEEIQKFFIQRRKEDREVLESYGAKVVHMGYLDALWRGDEKPNLLYKLLSIILKDFRYIYPTHRFHISKGVIHKKDRRNLKRAERDLKDLVRSNNGPVIFCPLGLGNHVDHIFTRQLCTSALENVIYWEDSPYNLYHKSDKHFIKSKELKRYESRLNQKERYEMYPGYKSQFGKLFGGKNFSLPVETYYFNESTFQKYGQR